MRKEYDIKSLNPKKNPYVRLSENHQEINMQRWKVSKIEDVCTAITDGAHNSPRGVTDGHCMVSVKDFTEYGFDFKNCKRINDEDYVKLLNQGCVPEYDDILVGKDGARFFEDIILYRQDEKPALLSSIAILRADKDKVLPEFLYYMLCSPDVKKDVRDNYGSGSAIPRIVLKDFKRMPFRYPNLDIQHKIVDVLLPIDRKIMENEKINKNLEEQATALLNTYCSRVTENIELGKIMSFENGFAFQSKTYLSSGQYRIITIKNVKDGRIDASGAAFINEIPVRMKSGCFLSEGDVLLSLTGNVGRTGIVFEDNLLLNQRVAKICPNDERILPWLYYYFRMRSTKMALEMIAKGTAQQNLSPTETLHLSVPFEAGSALQLCAALSPMFNKEVSNFKESLYLARLRESLLLGLMSGEIDVSDIDI